MRTIPFSKGSYAEEFMKYIVDKRGWSDLSNDCIMDIGCGVGMEKDSIYCFTHQFPHFKKLLGIDVRNTRENDDNIIFHVADITEISTLREWIGGVDKIISLYCFNCFTKHGTAFENVYQLLTPGGEAAIEFTLQSDFYDWVYDVSQRWPELSAGIDCNKPLAHAEKRRAPYYTKLLKEIGFNVLACKDETVLYVFSSDDECKTFIREVCFPVDNYTEDVKKRFEEELFEIFMRCTKRDKYGNIAIESAFLRVIIEKPNAGAAGIVQLPLHS